MAKTATNPQWGDEVLRFAPNVRSESRTNITRPTSPALVGDEEPETFVVDNEFAMWIRETFVNATGPLANEDHEHLADAVIGVLWTNAVNVTKQRTVMATAEIPAIQAGGWKRARFEFQLRQWFPAPIDFLLTFSGPECEQLSDRAFCALVDHELYHCAQALDRYGSPKFNEETGLPVFAIRGHDVEEFTGVVRRFGATSQDVRALVHAANTSPAFGDDTLDIACGVCAARAA